MTVFAVLRTCLIGFLIVYVNFISNVVFCVSAVPDEAPTIQAVKPSTTTSVLVQWQVADAGPPRVEWTPDPHYVYLIAR